MAVVPTQLALDPTVPGGVNLLTAWIAFAAGATSGIALGLFFHDAEWLGGYASWRRRLLRLGHIACFGLGLLNLAFALTVRLVGQGASPEVWRAPSVLMIVAAISMPTVCALAAWRKPTRHLFAIPVLSLTIACVWTAWVVWSVL